MEGGYAWQFFCLPSTLNGFDWTESNLVIDRILRIIVLAALVQAAINGGLCWIWLLQLFDGGNVTLSQLAVQLTPEDDGKKLVCRAENPQLGPSSAIEDSWLLDVFCKSRITFPSPLSWFWFYRCVFFCQSTSLSFSLSLVSRLFCLPPRPTPSPPSTRWNTTINQLLSVLISTQTPSSNLFHEDCFSRAHPLSLIYYLFRPIIIYHRMIIWNCFR